MGEECWPFPVLDFPWEVIYLTVFHYYLLHSWEVGFFFLILFVDLQGKHQQPCHGSTHFSLEICPSAHNELTQLLLQELGFLSTAGMGLANSVVRIFKTIRLTNLKPCLPTLILLVKGKNSLCCCLLSL